MQSNNIIRKLYFLTVLLIFLPVFLTAEDKRIIPLDMYLIIDDSSSMQASKNDAIGWINEQVIDRILADGDKITIWTAGDKAEINYSDTISGDAGKKTVKDKLLAMGSEGKTADFTGALIDAASRISQTPRDRLSYTMLITASAEGLEPVLTGNSPGNLKWFRSEKFQRWQVLVVAPDIGGKVQQAAAAYMRTLR